MLTDRTSEGSGEHALLDRAVLNLMLDVERQRPLAEDEIARALNVPGDVRRSLRRLRGYKLIHRWNDLAIAAHAAVRYCEITHGRAENQSDADERHHERAVLESLVTRARDGGSPSSERQIFETHCAHKRKQRSEVRDALDRLEAAGLIERRGRRAIASALALHLDQLMTV